MRYTLAIVTAFASFALARDGRAMVIVDYAFDSSNAVFSITSPAVVDIPPQGTLLGGIRVRYSSSAAGEIVDGPATLEILDLASELDISTNLSGFPVTLTGPANAGLVDPVDGFLTGDQLSFGGALGNFYAFGAVTCVGTICGFVGLPSGTEVGFSGTATAPVPTLTVASLHGTITGLSFEVGGLSIVASIHFDAPETGRMVPEPATAALLALGMCLGVFRRARG